MNLIATVEKIVLRVVSEEEAKNFALTRYGELCAYIRNEAFRKLRKEPNLKEKKMSKDWKMERK